MTYQGTTRPHHEGFAALAERLSGPGRPTAVSSQPACSVADHEALRTEVAETLADRRPFGSLTSASAASWLSRRRPWPDAECLVGECVCRSTIAIGAES